jgi:hypothetical protein
MRKYWPEILITLGIIVCLIPVYLYYHTFGNNGISEKVSNWASFADYFGGVTGTILTFFSIILIYATYKNQVKTSTLQQFETTFFNLLQNQREILKSMKGSIALNPYMGAMLKKGRVMIILIPLHF